MQVVTQSDSGLRFTHLLQRSYAADYAGFALLLLAYIIVCPT